MQSSTVYCLIAFKSGPFVMSTPHLVWNFCPDSEVWILPLTPGHSTTVVGLAADAVDAVLEVGDEDLEFAGVTEVADGIKLEDEEVGVATAAALKDAALFVAEVLLPSVQNPLDFGSINARGVGSLPCQPF